MRKKMILLTLMLLLSALSFSVLAFSAEQKALSQKLIRLHVVANSDSPYDQQIKLRVRDVVLKKANALLRDAENPEQTLQENLQLLADTAQDELCKLNYSADIKVFYQNERFPTRNYETFSLPAGVYKTLRVSIGQGRGHNWWCVVYPSLCLPGSMDDFEKAVAAADFSDGEIHLITADDAGCRFRFLSLELLQKFKAALFR